MIYLFFNFNGGVQEFAIRHFKIKFNQTLGKIYDLDDFKLAGDKFKPVFSEIS